MTTESKPVKYVQSRQINLHVDFPMKTVLLLSLIFCAYLSQHASAQDYSGLTINGTSRTYTDSDGKSIFPLDYDSFGFANDPSFPDPNLTPLLDLTYSDFDNSTLNGYLSAFQGCDFDHSSFQDAHLVGIGTSSWQADSFEYANLQGAVISGFGTSSFQGVDFYHANLQGAIFTGQGLSAFQGLDLDGTDFQGATIDSSTIFGDGETYQTTSFNWKAEGIILVVPEPSSWALGLLGLVAFSLVRRKSAKV